MALPLAVYEIDYPSSDGCPMAESDFQRKPLIYAVEALELYFQSRPDVYVSGNIFLYYEQGNPKMVVAPDVMVIRGTDKHDRSSYRLWTEPKGPDFVLEITSKSTRSEDQGPKRGVYAFLGVQEYWQYDPTGDYLRPSLQGFTLLDNNYQPIPARVLPEGNLALPSQILGLELRLLQGVLRFYDPVNNRTLPTYQEAEQARQQAEARIVELEARLRAFQQTSADAAREARET